MILLVDDEELQLLRLKNSCLKIMPNEDYLCYTNPKLAYEENIDKKIDIAFLDIEMPVINGIQLAKKLKRLILKSILYLLQHIIIMHLLPIAYMHLDM